MIERMVTDTINSPSKFNKLMERENLTKESIINITESGGWATIWYWKE